MAIDSPGLQAPALKRRAAVAAPRRFGRVNWLGVATLYRREMKRSRKDYIDGLLGPALTSLLMILIFKVAAGGTSATAGGLPLVDFVAPGLLMYAAGERAFSGACSFLIFDKLEGIIGDVVMAPLSAAERLAAYAAAAVSAGILAALASAALLYPFVHLAIASLPALLYFTIAGTLMLALLGILAGLWAERWEHFAALLTYFLVPFSYLSGMFYSVAGLPVIGRRLIAVNPLFYVIDGLRYGLTGKAESNLWTGVAVILAMNLLLAALLYRLFRRGWRLKA
jgi:ABC-2 type transport system permease protein